MKTSPTARLVRLAAAALIAGAWTGAGAIKASGGDQPAAAQSAEVPDVLNVQIGEFATLNPFLSSGIGRGSVNAAIYLPLVFLGADNSIQPGAASAWDESEDGLTYTFTIRDDLTWSDGEPFDSDDVLWSMAKYLDAELSQWASRVGGVAGQGESEIPSGLSAPDATTFVVEMAELNPSWLTVLAAQGHIIAMLPEHVLSEMTNEELASTDYFGAEPVTLGPYNFVEWEQDQFVELARNDEWPTPATFERVRLVQLQSEVAAAQLETGEHPIS